MHTHRSEGIESPANRIKISLRLFVGLCIFFCLASEATCEQVTVKLKDGREVRGEIKGQSEKAIVLQTPDGATVACRRSDIAEILDRQAYEKIYTKRALKIFGKGDSAAHRELAEWCFDHQLEEQGVNELGRAAETRDPDALREALKLAMLREEFAIAQRIVKRGLAVQPEDGLFQNASRSFDTLAALKIELKVARCYSSKLRAESNRANKKIAKLNRIIRKPYRTVTIKHYKTCPKCNGAGRFKHVPGQGKVGDPGGPFKCTRCKGRKKVVSSREKRRKYFDVTKQERERAQLQSRLMQLGPQLTTHSSHQKQVRRTMEQIVASLAADQAEGLDLSHVCYTRTFRGRYYRAFSEALTYSEAERMCKRLRGRLACVPDRETNEFLCSLSVEARLLWLGATYSTRINDWRWGDGARMKYVNWPPAEAAKALKGFYLSMDRSGYWHDCNKTDRLGFICEWESD